MEESKAISEQISKIFELIINNLYYVMKQFITFTIKLNLEV
jgi:hypothetical protein